MMTTVTGTVTVEDLVDGREEGRVTTREDQE